MDAYRLYYVATGKFKPGIAEEDVVKWWREKGADIFSYPGVKSLRAYAAQFGLAGKYDLEVWLELENYSALDKMDEWFVENPDLAKRKEDLWKESQAYFEWGPARLMGDFPESSLLPK
jgi:hypothetical protein